MVSISEMRRFLADLGAAASDLPATQYDVQNFFSVLLSLSLSLSRCAFIRLS
jgi:hypothetical protein